LVVVAVISLRTGKITGNFKKIRAFGAILDRNDIKLHKLASALPAISLINPEQGIAFSEQGIDSA
jgi:hypothetical protein